MEPQQLQFIYLTTLDSVHHLYQDDPSVLIPFLHPDVSWVRSTDSQCITGKTSVSSAMSNFRFTLPASPISLSCQVMCSDSLSCTLLCTCAAERRRQHCITLVWRAEDNSPKIIHIHGSISPAFASKTNADRIRSQPDAEPNLIFTGLHSERYYLNPSDILYVEADNICSRLICENRILHICQPISTVRELLPDCFLRIHRSFLVNVDHITSLRRYTVELQGGITLPVPEKKYKWLREYLDQYRKKTRL